MALPEPLQLRVEIGRFTNLLSAAKKQSEALLEAFPDRFRMPAQPLIFPSEEKFAESGRQLRAEKSAAG
jgi:hypothetical protein